MADRFREMMAERRPLLLDGGMGTMLQEAGALPAGACPEALNLERPEAVAAVHRAYAAAGSGAVTTNTFGGNRVKLSAFGLEGKADEVNAAAVRIARQAAGKGALVAGDIGPTGRFVAPLGDLPFDEAVEVFQQQALALAEAGADLIVCETFSDLRELKAAVLGARSACPLPVVATMTFEPSGATLLGISPEAAAVTLEAAGASAVGTNCGMGPEGIMEVLRRMAGVTSLPLVYQPNAGMPRLAGGKTVFPGTPQEVAAPAEELLALGAGVLGGCCGTTPAHLRALAEALRGRSFAPRPLPDPRAVRLASRSSVLFLGGRSPLRVIGERLNPTGRKALAAAVRAGDFSPYREGARDQAAAGADLLDVNVGVPGIDEPAAMARAAAAAQEGCALPLALDSARPEALEAGLRACEGKPLLNSVTGEEESLRKVLPLAARYGAAVLGLTLDNRGIPPRAEDRLAIAERIRDAARRAGLADTDLVIDALTLSAGAEQENVAETLRAVSLVGERLGLATSLGVSNVSFGLPAREPVNAAFLAMAAGRGLSAAIVNPHSAGVMETVGAARVILAQDPGSRAWIAAHAVAGAAPAVAPSSSRGEGGRDPSESLRLAVVDGDDAKAGELARILLSQGTPPLTLGEKVLIPAMGEVGDRFARNIYFLPQVVASARAMKAAFAPVREALAGLDLPVRGRILMATVEGDIHDIGKNMVITLLENHGFAVTDLGKNVPAEAIAEAIAKAESPIDAVGLSALMTTTMGKMREAVALLKERRPALPVAVGGAAVTEEFAREIGADGWSADATAATALFLRLVPDRKAKR